MKKFTLLLIACLTYAFLTAQSTELKYNLEANKTYRLKNSSVDNTTAQGMNTESKTDIVISIKPINLEEDFFIASVKFDTMNITNSMPAMKIESANEGDLTSSDPTVALNAIINRLCSNELIVRLDYTGKVLDVVNYDAVSKNIFTGIDQLEGQTKTVVEMQANIMASKDMISSMIEGTLHILPGKEVNTGDEWKIELLISAGGMKMKITTDYKLTSIDGNKATVEGKNVIVPASDEPMMMNGMSITSNIQGMGKINYIVDTETGFIISGSSEMQSSGTNTINAQGQTVEVQVEKISESTIKAL